MRVLIDWDRTVYTLLEQIQAQMLGIAEHEQYGLQHIQRAVGGDEASQFQLLLVVQPQQSSAAGLPGLFTDSRTLSASGEESTAQGSFNSYGIMIQAFYDEDGVSLDVNFDSASISKGQCESFVHQLEHILRHICSEKYNQLAARNMPLASTQDLQQVGQWNHSIPEVVSSTIIDLIEQNAWKEPDRVAVSGAIQLTYRELTDLSAAFAKSLLEMGVKPGDVVPMCMEKSALVPVVMLAVMKAGALVLPMASTTSVERAGAIVAALRPRLAITDLALFDGLIETVSTSKLEEASVLVGHGQVHFPKIDLSAPVSTFIIHGLTSPSVLLMISLPLGSMHLHLWQHRQTKGDQMES